MATLFENTETAFKLKSDADLERAYFLFKLISNEPLVKIGTAVTHFALKSKLPVENLIRATVFDHFCGGTTEEECMPNVEKMHENGVHTVLDYSVEGAEKEAVFDACLTRTLRVMEFVKTHDSIPFAVFKPSGFGRFVLYEKQSSNQPLSAVESEEWARVVGRFERCCQRAADLDIMLLVDAEESWIQPAVDQIVENMMRRFNKNHAIVFNTIQLYRHDRFDYVKKICQEAEEESFFVGLKLVRGAYMEKERARAHALKYISPICADKQTTDKQFNDVSSFLLNRIRSAVLFFGTHNEQSVLDILSEMKKLGIKNNDSRVWFGQLYGMSDHISFNLADEGYNVAKYLPFGPVKDVMPYLIRRAEENTSVAGQTNRELELLKKERVRRKLG